MAWKPASNTPLEDEPITDIATLDAATQGAGSAAAQAKFGAPGANTPFMPASAVPVDEPADVADDENFDEFVFAAQNAGDPAAEDYAFQVHQTRAAQGFKNKAGQPFKHYQHKMTLGDVASGFGSFVRGSVMAAPRLVKQGYQAATGSPAAATTTAENIIGAQMAGENLESLMRAGLDWGKSLPEGYAEQFFADPNRRASATELLPKYLAARPEILERGKKVPYGQKFGPLLQGALAKLDKGEKLTADESAELGIYAAGLEPEAAQTAELKNEFTKRVKDTRESMQLASGRPLDEGIVADYLKARGVTPSETFGPESLAAAGAPPVDPGAAAGVAAAVDPVNAALLKVPGLPGVRRVGGALVAGAGKTLQGVGALSKVVSPRVLKTGAVGAGLYALAGGDVERAGVLLGGVAAAKGLAKVGQVGRFLTEAGQEAMTAGTKVAPATGALAAARRAGQIAPAQTAKVAAANTLIDMAAMPLGAAPINAVFSRGDMDSFWALTAGAPLFGTFGVLQGIRPQLMNAIRPQLRAEGKTIFENLAKGRWGKASQEAVDAMPEEQRNMIYEMNAAIGGLRTQGEGGQEGVAQIIPLKAKDYNAFKKENGLGEGDDRGFALHDGKAYINTEHPTALGKGGAFQAAHTAGHEFGGHVGAQAMRAATTKGGPLYEVLVKAVKAELGKGKELQQFVEGYNKAAKESGLPDDAQININDPIAVEEFLAETAGRIFSTEGAAGIAIAPGIRDKIQTAVGRLFGAALGVGGQSNFGHQENAKVTGLYMDALRQIADPNVRRVTQADAPEQADPNGGPAPKPTKGALAPPDPARADAELALIALGWPANKAKAAAQAAPGQTTEEIVKSALAAATGAPTKPTTAPVKPPVPALAPTPVAAVAAAAPEPAQPAAPKDPQTIPGPGGRAILAGGIQPAPTVKLPALAPKPAAPEPAKSTSSFETKMQESPDVVAARQLIADAPDKTQAALDLVDQAAQGDPALLQKRVDPLTGRVSYAGRLDFTRPEHRVLAEQLGLPEAEVAKLQNAQTAGGDVRYVDYWSASKLDPADITGKQRAKELLADKAKKSRDLMQKDKAIVFTGVEVFPSGKMVQKGISVDKLIANTGKLLQAAKDAGLPVDYQDINDPQIIADLQGYVANHKAGFKGDGSGPVKGKTQAEGYEPYLIPRNRFDLLNAAFNIDISTAKTAYAAKQAADAGRRALGDKVRKRAALRPETELKAEDAQARALENGWQVDDATGDTNPFRALLNREGKIVYEGAGGKRQGTQEVLESVFENLSPDMIDAIREQPAGERSIVREVGFTGEPGKVLEKGLPDFRDVAAGFMPGRQVDQAHYKGAFPAPREPLAPDDPMLRDTRYVHGRVKDDGTTDWIPERKALHEEIYNDALTAGRVSDKPVAYLIGGPMAAGKTTMIEVLRAEGVLPPKEATTYVNPDDIKMRLPEMQRFIELKEDRGATAVHEESSEVSKELLRRAIAAKKEILTDKGWEPLVQKTGSDAAYMPNPAIRRSIEAEWKKAKTKPANYDDFIKWVRDTHGKAAAGNGAAMQELWGKLSGKRGKFMPAETGGFYSQLERVAKDKIKGRATAEQIAATLRNNGVKQEELDWVLGDYLRGKAGQKIEPKELAEVIAANRVELKEIALGDNANRPALEKLMEENVDIYENDHGLWFAELPEDWGGETIKGTSEAEVRNEVINYMDVLREEEALDVPPGPPAKFTQYQLPGGRNYRELLFTLPQNKATLAELQEREVLRKKPKLTEPELERLAFLNGRALGGAHEPNQFRTSHFDEPNVVFHIRANDRQTADGLEITFAEEFQSDWHQQGRKKGYKGDAEMDANAPFTVRQNEDGTWEVVDKNNEVADDAHPTREVAERIANQLNAPQEVAGTVPNAPFKGNAWKTLALKKLLEQAVRAGKDGIGWTTGKQQAERYDLSKQVDSIEWYAPAGLPDNHYAMVINPIEGGSSSSPRFDFDASTGKIVKGEYSGKGLDEVVGKEIAEKILSSGKGGELSGLDLKIGGEGMKGFYDKELVNIANDLGKRYGARVEKGASGTPQKQERTWQRHNRDGTYSVMRGQEEVKGGLNAKEADNLTDELATESLRDKFDIWVLPITPQLKAAVEAGQALFMPDGKSTSSFKTKMQKRGALSGFVAPREERKKPALADY